MSEKPRRWDIECTGIGDDVDMVERPKGNYVLMEDYARLKAEVEQLMVFCNCTLIPNKELQAKVERLTKAGDNVVADLEHLTKSGWFDKCKSVKRWNAAKEGKPSHEQAEEQQGRFGFHPHAGLSRHQEATGRD